MEPESTVLHLRGGVFVTRTSFNSFIPENVSYGYHLCADLMGELLRKSANARHIDAKVLNITKVDGPAARRLNSLTWRQSDTTWSLTPAGSLGSYIPTGTSMFLSYPPIRPLFGAARPSSRLPGMGRSWNIPIPVRLRVPTAGQPSFRLRHTQLMATFLTGM